MITFALVVIILLSAGLYFVYMNYSSDDNSMVTDNNSRGSSKPQSPPPTDSYNVSDPNRKAPINTQSGTDTSKTSDEFPVSTTISAEISHLTQTHGVVSYSATISGAETGTCSALFTNPIGKPVTRASETTTGVCNGDIPDLEFDALGEWTLQLTFYANNTQAVATKTITIK